MGDLDSGAMDGSFLKEVAIAAGSRDSKRLPLVSRSAEEVGRDGRAPLRLGALLLIRLGALLVIRSHKTWSGTLKLS